MQKEQHTQFEAVQIFTDFLAAHPSDEDVLRFRLPSKIQERIQDLATKNNAGTISEDELIELREYERLDVYAGLLKTKIMQKKMSISK